MSNWDLMMPGMGLVAIGLAGVVISYAEIAHTFIDGMHALTGLTMFFGLIFLASGILEGGVSTSNKAKATTLVILGIVLSFAMVGVVFSTVSTIPLFAGVMMIITIPAIIIAYVNRKYPVYSKPISIIFILAAIAGILAYVMFGLVSPDTYILGEQVIEEEQLQEVPTEPVPAGAPVFAISILEGSSIEGNPDYEPDVANVPQGHVVEWTNGDTEIHTVTSSLDVGETFNSGMMNPGDKFSLDTNELALGEYEYMCIVHPWMIATLVVQEPQEPVIKTVTIPQGASIQQIGQVYYDPEVISVSVGTTAIWENEDNALHTVTSGTPEEGPDEVFDAMLNAGDSFEYTFDTAGTYDYYCIVHPWMIGSVIVE